MKFCRITVLILLTVVFLGYSTTFGRRLKRQEKLLNPPKTPKCICPGVEKPVCSWSRNRRLNQHTNLCFAKCSSAESDFGTGIIPGSICTELKKQNATFEDSSSPQYLSMWMSEMEKEVKFYMEIDKYMKHLLRLAGSSSDERCICPPLTRIIESFGITGSIIRYNNLCSAVCQTRSNPLLGISIFPWRIYNRKDSKLSFEKDAEVNFDYYMDKWKEDMKSEILFYKKVNHVMYPLNSI